MPRSSSCNRVAIYVRLLWWCTTAIKLTSIKKDL